MIAAAGGRAEHLGKPTAATLKARPSDVLAIVSGVIFDGGLGTAALTNGRAFRETGRRVPSQPSALSSPPR